MLTDFLFEGELICRMTRCEFACKWSAYALCIFLLLFVRSLLPRSLTPWGVLPFFPPVLLACVVSLEPPRSATVFALVFGVVCDLFFSASLPCLYTLAFPISALLTAYFSSFTLQNRFLRALFGTVLTFLITDALRMLALTLRVQPSFSSMLFLTVRETAVSIPLLLCFPLFVRVHRAFTL